MKKRATVSHKNQVRIYENFVKTWNVMLEAGVVDFKSNKRQ